MNRDLRFLVLSDPHLFANPSGSLRGINTLNSLRRVLRDVVARKFAFDAVICTGDIVNDEPEGYAHFARELGVLDKPVYCIPGNHDDPARLRASTGGTALPGGWPGGFGGLANRTARQLPARTCARPPGEFGTAETGCGMLVGQ